MRLPLSIGDKGSLSYILQGEDPHSRNLSPPLASMRLPSPSETAAQRKGSGGSSPSRWDSTKADAYGAATANGTASQRPPISLRKMASTITANGSSSHLQGRRYKRGKSQLKTNFGKKCVPLSLASMRLPSPSETAAQAEALWRLFTFQMGQQ